MADQAREQITIQASTEQCFTALLDLSSYPQWVPDLKEVSIIETDDHGRASVVEFRAAGMGRSTTYRLRYDYSGAPEALSWTLVEGDIERAIDGSYTLEPTGDGDTHTQVTYELAISLKVPIPGFVKRRGEERIIKAALPALKAHVESATG